MNKTVMVLGGDGFCGWPTSLYLSHLGHKIIIVDDFSRRKIDIELGVKSLTPIEGIHERIKAWRDLTNEQIVFKRVDVSRNYLALLSIINKLKPDVIIHYAEQRAAPYSMKSPVHRIYTVHNNIQATHNVLCAIVESGLDIHLVHLGSTGVYGYSEAGLEIPEGYLTCKVKDIYGEDKEIEILFPADPGSVYHTTKTMDALMFYYYNKNDGVVITDLHQGIIWGCQTEQTMMDERLINRFDYDGDYGTVLNRFLIQSVVNHPLTVYGTGGQTRAFISIKDSVKCIALAIKNPPCKGCRVKIFNQTTEQLNIYELAKRVSKLTGAQVRLYKNPRNEPEENKLKMSNKGFMRLGLEPTLLDEKEMKQICDIIFYYKKRIDMRKIICTSLWSADKEVDYQGVENEREQIHMQASGDNAP